MEVDLNLSPFKEYQDLCMCLFYNEFIPLVSFLPVHKFFLRRKYIAGFIQSLKMLAVNRPKRFRPGTQASVTLLPPPSIFRCSHFPSYQWQTLYCTVFQWSLVISSSEGRRCLMSSIASLCYKSAASFRKVVTHFSMGCVSHFDHWLCGSLAFGKERSEKVQKIEVPCRADAGTEHLHVRAQVVGGVNHGLVLKALRDAVQLPCTEILILVKATR